MQSEDYYAVLGVLPDAEDVVIIAAYRALAQRYHPDRWSGDLGEGHRRMSEINQAYAELGDKTRRAAYDSVRTHTNKQEFTSDGEDERTEAFTSALKGLEDRWIIACRIYHDLIELRSRLARISTSLAFEFVYGLLETKNFSKRTQIALHLEKVFLERYFGTSQKILAYARSLIIAGRKKEAKALNQLVDVMGSELDPNLLIDQIEKDFGPRDLSDRSKEILKRSKEAEQKRERIVQLEYAIRARGYYDDALEYSQLLGYEVEEFEGSIFKQPKLVVKTPAKEILRFGNAKAFILWVQESLCSVR